MLPARRALTAAVLAAAVGVAVAGCGNSTGVGSGPGGGAVDSGSPAPGAAQDRAKAALLVPEEMPLGFSRQDSTGDATALGCPGIDALYLAAGTTGLASVSYAHALNDVFVNETVTVRPDGAADAVAKFSAATRDCRTFTGAQGTSYQVTGLPGLTRYGDGSAAVRVRAGLREGRPVDLVAVRVGDLVLVLANATSGKVDGELTRTLVQRAVARARKAA